MEPRVNNRGSALSAILIAPDRELSAQFVAASAPLGGFAVLAELKCYPSEQTIDIRMRQLDPDVVLLDVATDLNRGLEIIAHLSCAHPEVSIVALDRQGGSDTVLRALRAGACEFLYSPFDANTMGEAFARLVRLRKPDPVRDNDVGTIAAFSSAKPGSGASTLAAQTAFALRRRTGQRVLLVDLDLWGGTIGFYLKLESGTSVLDVIDQVDAVTPASWNSIVSNSNGLDVLPAPPVPVDDTFDLSRIHTVLDYARTIYDWVLVDLPVVFQRISLITMSQADRTFLVSTCELPCLHLARRAVNLLEQLGLPKERFHVILNRLSKHNKIKPADMDKLFNCAVHASMPNDYFSLHRVVTLGQPLDDDGELAEAVEALASSLTGLAKNAADVADDYGLVLSAS
jgi:pilus assembly protein CpaE